MSVSTSISIPNYTHLEIEKALYRIVQEALTNTSRYAQATAIEVKTETTADCIQLTVMDNGKGFNLAQKTDGFGLQGMRERVAALNGNFRIESTPGKGCQIQVTLPLRTTNADFLKPQTQNLHR